MRALFYSQLIFSLFIAAKKVFEEVGGELQRQRMHGVAESLLCFIEETADPAEEEGSSELNAQLKENSKHWNKINDVGYYSYLST